MILLIDNYDSFVHNLARYLAELGTDPLVVRNDAMTVDDVMALKPEAIILSPGPCTPHEAGITLELIGALGSRIPMLGVCLGHQAIGVACGAPLVRASEPMHGRTSHIQHDERGVFASLPSPLVAMRYHSLILSETTWPDYLEITARTPEGAVMGIRHREWPLHGVQFHPESILTEQGHAMLGNFLTIAGVDHHPYQSQEVVSAASPSDDFYQREFDPDATALG